MKSYAEQKIKKLEILSAKEYMLCIFEIHYGTWQQYCILIVFWYLHNTAYIIANPYSEENKSNLMSLISLERFYG